MMYEVKYIHRRSRVENPLYIPGSTEYCLIQGRLHIGLGIAGELELSVPSQNPALEDLQFLTDEIVVYRNGIELWRGRAVSSSKGFDLTETITCEGCLSYLYDTYSPPYEYGGTPFGFFNDLIQNHNSRVDSQKRFQIGLFTVTDKNDYIYRKSKSYNRTLSVLLEKLQNSTLGGYLRVRVENGKKYLDYISSTGSVSLQPAVYGYNILDVAVEVEYVDLFTALLPLGARIDEETYDDDDESYESPRLTIESVNDGSAYIFDADAVEKYGWICTCVEYDDITLPENLLKRGKEYLDGNKSAIKRFTIRAVDMNAADGSVKSWQLGDEVYIESPPHGVDITAVLTDMDIDLLDVSNNVLTFGNQQTLTDHMARANQSEIESRIDSEAKHRRNAYAELQKALEESSGFFHTKVEQGNGAAIHYVHDKKALRDSQCVFKLTSDAIGLSTDGGNSYPYGFTVTGAMVMDIIQSTGIDAKYIYVGQERVDESINGLNDQMTRFSVEQGMMESRISNVTSKVQNMSVGSRNYIRCSKTLDYSGYTFVEKEEDQTAFVGTAIVGVSEINGIAITADRLNALESSHYTILEGIKDIILRLAPGEMEKMK